MPARDHADDVFEDEVGVPDLVLLPRIGEEDIAANLRLRAERGLIYSCVACFAVSSSSLDPGLTLALSASCPDISETFCWRSTRTSSCRG
jgi:hypothetical protein